MIRPIRNQVLVRQDPAKETTTGGLYLPQGSELWPNLATVLAVGPGLVGASGKREPTGLAVGDRVLFKRRAGTALVPDTREGGHPEWKDLLMLLDTDVIGIVVEE